MPMIYRALEDQHSLSGSEVPVLTKARSIFAKALVRVPSYECHGPGAVGGKCWEEHPMTWIRG